MIYEVWNLTINFHIRREYFITLFPTMNSLYTQIQSHTRCETHASLNFNHDDFIYTHVHRLMDAHSNIYRIVINSVNYFHHQFLSKLNIYWSTREKILFHNENLRTRWWRKQNTHEEKIYIYSFLEHVRIYILFVCIIIMKPQKRRKKIYSLIYRFNSLWH